ncbi:hypothetical protein A6A04_07065 [Paramagnetospirillum marisnigri]|uniref:DUF3124 domain-containing protein n=1 Tax=Paramagnetospirillum marisnigri TaxID=1285242 RepID=A0A178MAT6_9PROT|nr:DUF3124 domain-containing protein [Paramagnetospirillum marisnigri]OAN45646.1 hypothetical protein A6A04_07065 [Paramagnetospirillum marisnigri]
MRLVPMTAALLLSILLAHPAVAEDVVTLSKGQSVYVPVYSHISHGNLDSQGQPMTLLLSAMLSIRNTDLHHPITVKSARYYDTDGKVLKEFVAKPVALGAMASMEQFIEHRDKSGGSGANFVVEWVADKPVNPPIIETVNAYFFGTQSVAFTSPGRVIQTKP